MMPESFPEQVNRLAAMMHDDGQTWDLTQNDQAAIRAVLAELNRLEVAYDQLLTSWAECKQLKAQAEQQRDAALAALEKYGQHPDDCWSLTPVDDGNPYDCNCGFDAALHPDTGRAKEQ